MLNDFQNQAIARFTRDMQLLKLPFTTEETTPHLMAMADSMQHKTWHAEGDVLTHTHMVVNALDEVLIKFYGTFDYVNNEEHQRLLLACWFHDFGKPVVMRWNEKKQKNTFYDHERDSAGIWRNLCWKHGIDVTLTEAVCSLVRCHGEPVKYATQGATDQTFKKLASQVSPRLLYLVEQADFHGRICDDLASALDALEKFKATCERLGIYEQDPSTILTSKASADSLRLPSDTKTLILPIAIPGTGKTYLRQKLLEHFDVVVVSPDDIRTELYGDAPYDPTKNQEVFGTAHRRVREALDNPRVKYIYFDAQNATLKDRDTLLDLARQRNVESWGVWFAKPLTTILRQNSSRTRVVDEKYVVQRVNTLQYPALGEFSHVIHVSE